jgi:amino acid permease
MTRIDGLMQQTTEPEPVEPTVTPETLAEASPSPKKNKVIWIILGIVLFLLLVAGTVFMLASSTDTTGKIRDVFIIFLALQSFIIGAVLIILIVQMSILINLVQNELKPIIKNTSETVNALKGTASFLSNHLAQPVIRVNSFFARIKRFFELIRPKWW